MKPIIEELFDLANLPGPDLFPRGEAMLNAKDESDRLEIATQLYERFCADLVERSDKARVRLISGIQAALRDASEGVETHPPYRKEPN